MSEFSNNDNKDIKEIIIEPEIVTEKEEKNNAWHKIIFNLAMLELELNA